jgi:hypothetical protein
MMGFLKTFAKGVLYVVTLPLMILILALFALCGMFYFIFLSIKSVVLFFQGKTIFTELEEDKKAKEILYGKTQEETTQDLDSEDSTSSEIETEPEVISEPIKEEINTNNEPVIEEETPQAQNFIPLEEPAPSLEELIEENNDIQSNNNEKIIIDSHSNRIFDDLEIEDDNYDTVVLGSYDDEEDY